MFLIWRGWGILMVLGVMLGGILGAFIVSLVSSHVSSGMFPALIAMGCSIGAYGTLRLLQHTDKGRVVIDKQTGEEVVLVRGDSVFFIPVRFWFYLIVALTVLLFGLGIFMSLTAQ